LQVITNSLPVVSRHTVTLCCLAGLLVLTGCLGAEQSTQHRQPQVPGPADAPSTTSPGGQVNGTLEVHVIAVGQATSVLVVGPTGETMLYDTGHYEDDGAYVRSYLDGQGIDRIDHLVLSHADADHIGGAGPLIDHYETDRDGVGAVHDPGIPASTRTYDEYRAAVDRHDVPLYQRHEGDTLDFGTVDADVLGPAVPYLDNGTHNANSLVLRLGYGNTSVLLTGDAEADQERYLVDRYGRDLNVTVLTAGHHGSFSSSKESFLDATDPERVAISSAYDSEHGHPDRTVLTRLTARGIPAYWTGTHGTTNFTSDGDTVTVRTQAADPIVATALRTGEPLQPAANDSTIRRETVGDGPSFPRPRDAVAPANHHLELIRIQADAPGNDFQNINGEFVVFENTGRRPLSLANWTVHDAIGHRYTVPKTMLWPGQRFMLHTGGGVDNTTHHYWNESDPVWNNDGDTVLVTTPAGYPIVRETYGRDSDENKRASSTPTTRP
jgi:competence protein ComEC